MHTNQKPGPFIVERINKTRRQVRVIELVTLLVTLIACVSVFLFASVLVDHWLFKNGTPTLLRYLGLLLIGGGIAYFVWRLIPVLRLSINPAYAAEVLEKNHPGMKNRLLNWVFLHREKRDKTSPNAKTERMVIDSIGRETAANLNVMPDQLVVDCTAMIRWGIVLAVVLALFCVYMVLSPKNTLQSVARVAPFFDIEPPQSIVIKSVEPGNVTAYQGETIQVKARLDRATKKPVHLVYSTADGRLLDQRVPMQGSEDGMRFECRFPPGKRGFEESVSYRVEVGDGRSGNYTVTVKPSITIDVKSIEYRYPAYTNLPPQMTESSGDLRAVEGTQVTINASSNIAMSRAILLPDGDASRAIRLEISPSKTEAKGVLTLGFAMDQPMKPVCTSYSLRCWDDEQRTNLLPSLYRIETVRDESPTIKWADQISNNEPLQVALNEPFDVAVEARDPDFGLQQLQLRGTISRVVKAVVQRDGNTLPETSDLPLENMELLKDPPRTGTVTIKKTIVPSKLGLLPGDRVSYFAEAIDVKQPNANTATTPPRVFVVTEINPDKPLDPPVNDEPQDQQKQDQGQGDQQQQGEQQEGQNEADNQNQSDDTSQNGNQGEDTSENQGDDQQSDKQQPSQKEDKSGDEQNRDGNDQQQNKPQQQKDQQPKDQQTEEQRQQGKNSNQQEQDTSNTGDADSGTGNSEQRNQSGGQSSDESGNGANQQGTGGEQKPDNSPSGDQSDGGNSANHDANSQNQSPQTGNQSTGNQQGQQNQNNSPNNTSNNTGPQNTQAQQQKRNQPIDGESSPGDVFNEVIDHMRDKGEWDDNNNRDASQNNQEKRQSPDHQPDQQQPDQKNQNGSQKENSPDNTGDHSQNSGSQNGSNTSNDATGNANDTSKQDIDPSRKGEHVPGQTPEQDDTHTTDRTDGYHTQDGNDPNAEQLDPKTNKPILGGENDTGSDATEANGPGQKMVDDKSQGDLPRGDNAREVDPNNTEDTGMNAKRSQTDETSGGQRDNQPGNQGNRKPNGQDDQTSGNQPGSNQQQKPGQEKTSNAGDQNESANGGNEGQSAQQQGNASQPTGGNSTSTGGGGTQQRNRGDTPGMPQETPSVPDEANLDYTRQATDLAIRYLEDELGKEQPDQQLLDRLGGWNQNDLRRFVDRWREMQQQSQQSNGTKESKKFEETLRNIGNLAPKATIGTQRDNRQRVQTTTTESQRYAPPKGKYENLMKAYTEGINK